MSDQPDHETLAAQLRQLANRWTLKARDYARESKARNANADVQTAYYHRGIAETYYKLAVELAELIRQIENAPAEESAPVFSEQEPAPEPAVTYADIPLEEATRILHYAGINAREVDRHKGNVYTAIFSRWQPFSDTERIEKLKGADLRIVIVGSGRMRDTSDPYIEFAFKQ